MNKFTPLIGLAAVTLAFPAFSETPAEEPVQHYEAVIETKEAAFEALKAKTAIIAEILKKEGELEFTDMESVHEITYTLEASIDKLRAENAADTAKIDALDEAVQALHYASENQEEAKSREWFAKLEPITTEILNASVEPAAPAEAPLEKKEFYEITIKNHIFSPAELHVPAGQKIKLIVDNQDATPEEFESHDFNREKIIVGNTKATIFVGPLKAGKYHYFGEFNMDSANGYIIAE